MKCPEIPTTGNHECCRHGLSMTEIRSTAGTAARPLSSSPQTPDEDRSSGGGTAATYLDMYDDANFDLMIAVVAAAATMSTPDRRRRADNAS